MRYGDQFWLMHLIRAIALFTIGVGVILALFVTIEQLTETGSLTAEEASTLGNIFEALGFGTLAIFTWSFIEFAAAVWSISYVQRGASFVRARVAEVAR